MKSSKFFAGVAGTIIKIIIIGVIVFLLYRFLLFTYDIGYNIFAAEAIDRAPGISRSIAIADGKGVSEIGKLLEEKGLVDHAYMFVLQEMFSDYHGELKAGVYELSTAMTPYEMMEIMANGEQEKPQSALDELTSREEDVDFEDELEEDYSDEYIEEDISEESEE